MAPHPVSSARDFFGLVPWLEAMAQGQQVYPEMDRISNVPPGVIEIILCLLPTQEAVRTSILSREWRYRWIKIPKLVFEEYKFQVSADGAELPVLLSKCITSQEVNHTYISHSIDTFTIIDLFECLTVIESLSIPFGIFEIFKPFVHGRVPRELPTTLHLKFLYMHDVCFTQKQNDGLSILVLLMKSSPKLEKIEIDNMDLDEDDSSMEDELFTEDDLHSFKLEDYSDIWLEHMRELHIVKFKNWGNELNFVKLILAKSPLLKKARMRIDYRMFDEDEKLQMYQMLLSSPRASPVVDFIFN
ncbi:F-box/FBD/LRR-repeat protein-like protein [Tanacetum coccineum]